LVDKNNSSALLKVWAAPLNVVKKQSEINKRKQLVICLKRMKQIW
jgi:hypothetical protein